MSNQIRKFDQATVNAIYEHYFSQEKQHLFEDLDYDTYNYQYNTEYTDFMIKLYSISKITNIYLLVRITYIGLKQSCTCICLY